MKTVHINTASLALAITFVSLVMMKHKQAGKVLKQSCRDLGQRVAVLREAETKYRSLFENSLLGMYRTTRTGRFIEANPAMAQMLGYGSPSELQANVTDIAQQLYLEPELRGKLISLLEERNVVEGFEVQFYRKDGSVIWVSLSASAIRDDTGKITYYEGVARDITERKHAEEALRFSEARYRALHRDIPTMIFTLDTEGTVLSVNPYGASQLGYSIEELEGEPVLNVFHPEDRDHVADQLRTCLQNPGQVYRWQFRKIRKDGVLLWVEELAQAVYDLNGVPNVLVVCRDITERKRADEQIALLQTITGEIAEAGNLNSALEVLLRRVCEKTGWVLGQVWLPRQDETVLECCPAWFQAAAGVEKFRIASEALTFPPGTGFPGRIWSLKEPLWIRDVTVDANFPRAPIAAEAGLKSALGLPILSGDQVVAVIEFFMRETRTEDEQLVVIITAVAAQLGSVIERKRAEEALLRAHEELEQKVVERTSELSEANAKLMELDRLKSMFIASMSHELRTPLNSVIGFASVLLNEWAGPVKPEQKENLAAILRSGKHLLALVNDVIDVSKIEAGKIDSHMEEFDVHDLVEEAVDFIKENAREKGLALQTKALHRQVATDRRRLLQCLTNLLTNAVKFTERGCVTVGARRCLAQEDGRGIASPIQSECIEISVEDTGIGIRQEDLPKLFQPFMRLVYPNAAVVPGTGLGLYLTRRLVTEVLKGEIRCTSRYGEGSIFTLKIPGGIIKTSMNYEG